MTADFWQRIEGGVHPAVAAWFDRTFGEPTEPQRLAWPAIAKGDGTLLLAPTGSGKTLAAFLMAINSLCQQWQRGELPDRVSGPQILYISPLRALNNDVHRNLEQPLAGIVATASTAGMNLPPLRAAVRTGDTSPEERRRMLREPPHILITTPESLFLMLCSKARETLRYVRTVIIDETHALFPNKRGVLLSLALEYLEDLTPGRLQRIGLSATQRPLEAIAAFVAGGELARAAGQDTGPAAGGDGCWRQRPLTLVAAPGQKRLDLAMSLPVADFADLPEHTIWPEIHREIYRLADQHRTTLVFVNNRQVGERIAAAVNDLAGEDFCRVHHGSISREMRLETEQLLKAGQLRCLVATSTLELGIDVGQIDLVIQVESPHEVARAMQRVGRSGHVPGSASKGRIIPKTRHDLLEASVISDLMRQRWIEPQSAQENALDVLAQFVVGLTIERPRQADDIYQMVRRAYGYRSLSRERFDSVLAMAAGRLAPGESLDLRPLISWDDIQGTVQANERGRRLIYTSGGTIPDRGNFPVYLHGQGVRLGELDEEFVYERRLGDRFSLGTSSWRITEISDNRVVVVPAGGGPRVPFWKGETFGRPYLLGCAVAGFLRQADQALAREREAGDGAAGSADPFWANWGAGAGLDASAVAVLRGYLRSQAMATGRLPSANALIIEEFRDELGQWRTVIHSPFGRAVNAPLALLLEEQIGGGKPSGTDVVVTDDAILFGGSASEVPVAFDLAALDAVDLAGRLSGSIRRTQLFGRLFREAAGRALVLPRLPHGRRRTPFWLSRRRASSLLRIAEQVAGFPLIHEALREAMSDVYDLSGLVELIGGLHKGTIQVVRVRRNGPSPFARPVMFAYMGAFLYADDLPPAERRLRFLGLDQAALEDLLGQAPMRDLLDPVAIAAANASALPEALTRQAPPDAHALYDWLCRFGELPDEAVAPAMRPMLQALAEAGNVMLLDLPGGHGISRQAWLPVVQAAEWRAALAGDSGALATLVRRYALRHSPFTLAEVAGHIGIAPAVARGILDQLTDQGSLRRGAFRPGGTEQEWSDPGRLAEMHRRSLALARQAVQPVAPEVYQVFLARWQGLGKAGGGSGVSGLVAALAQLEGLPLSAHAWEETLLPSRVAGYSGSLLDGVTTTGQFRWVATGRLDRLRIAFWRAADGAASGAAPAPAASETSEPLADMPRPDTDILGLLRERGAQFVTEIWRSLATSPGEVLAALERLLALGMVTNDTFGPVRYLLGMSPASRSLPRTVTTQVLAGMARWSLVDVPSPEPPATAARLLARYGLVCREVVAAEGLSWSDFVPLLSRMEMLGQVRRGYFVRGLSGMQFALPDAVEQLRAAARLAGEATGAGNADPGKSASAGIVVLTDDDPALAWGRILPWPEDSARPRPPFALAMVNGEPVLVGEGRPLRIEAYVDRPAGDLVEPLRAMLDVAQLGARDRLEVASFRGLPIRSTPAEDVLAQLGFSAAPLTMVRWGL